MIQFLLLLYTLHVHHNSTSDASLDRVLVHPISTSTFTCTGVFIYLNFTSVHLQFCIEVSYCFCCCLPLVYYSNSHTSCAMHRHQTMSLLHSCMIQCTLTLLLKNSQLLQGFLIRFSHPSFK